MTALIAGGSPVARQITALLRSYWGKRGRNRSKATALELRKARLQNPAVPTNTLVSQNARTGGEAEDPP